jgi:hypothetical protein
MHMSLGDSNEQRFCRAYRIALLGLALAWHTVLLVGVQLPEGPDLVGAVMLLGAWGLAPYLLLAGLADRISHRPVLLTSSVFLFGGDVMSGMGVLRPGSSTDAVAIATYPCFAIFVLVPITWVVSWFFNR